jgi:hypothetical protein
MKVARLFAVLVFCALVFCRSSAGQSGAYTFTPLDDPLAAGGPLGGTTAYGISGSTIVGTYTDANLRNHGFVYDGSGFTTLDDPLGASIQPSTGTIVHGVSGSRFVGEYTDSNFQQHGFVYDGSIFTTLDVPMATNTIASGISGNTVVGWFSDASGFLHGFIYNGSTYTPLSDPSTGTLMTRGDGTQFFGISGNVIVGAYRDSTTGYVHGLVYNGTTFTDINGPAGSLFTDAYGSSGTTVVGTYAFGSGPSDAFVYDGLSYTTVDFSPANETLAYGISGDSVVGVYYENSGHHGFIATPVPEPIGLAAAVFGWAALLIKRPRGPESARRRG